MKLVEIDFDRLGSWRIVLPRLFGTPYKERLEFGDVLFLLGWTSSEFFRQGLAFAKSFFCSLRRRLSAMKPLDAFRGPVAQAAPSIGFDYLQILSRVVSMFTSLYCSVDEVACRLIRLLLDLVIGKEIFRPAKTTRIPPARRLGLDLTTFHLAMNQRDPTQ